jgi:glycosyltransferase involved in cell wall biosynthesis
MPDERPTSSPPYSIIVPVYNRPAEVEELLGSLTRQTVKDFEVIVVEDGSHERCDEAVKKFERTLRVRYVVQENAGPGMARNRGAKEARGETLLFLDSDCLVPESYLEEVDRARKATGVEFFGGPDRAHESFSPIQKAVSFAMTSFVTTGGIRGGARRVDVFYPRSFNMGCTPAAFENVGGFSSMRFGEDLDLSMRLLKAGYRSALFERAFVYHKRRTGMGQFFKQVFSSGSARIDLWKRHPESLRFVHLLPSLFTVALAASVVLASLARPLALGLFLVFALVVLVEAAWTNRSLAVGLAAVMASFVQLIGYGLGFLSGWWKRVVLQRSEETRAF